MNQNQESQSAESADRESSTPATGIRRYWRPVVSALVVLHLAAVVIPPFHFASRPNQRAVDGPAVPSPFAEAALYPARPYCDMAFLSNGYAFFAPDPGPSHVVRYRAEFNDGREPIEGQFPDVNEHFPRLWYHRHFMLAEHLNAAFVPPEPPPKPEKPRPLDENASPEDRLRWEDAVAEWEFESNQWGAVYKDWQRVRAIYEHRVEAFKNRLKTAHGADKVSIWRVQHGQPARLQFLEGGWKLDDSRLYFNLDPPGEPAADKPAVTPEDVLPPSASAEPIAVPPKRSAP